MVFGGNGQGKDNKKKRKKKKSEGGAEAVIRVSVPTRLSTKLTLRSDWRTKAGGGAER